MRIKNFLPILLLVFLNSCSSLPDNVASNFKLAYNSIEAAIFGFEDYPITKELVDQIPYASMRVKIGKGPAGLLILESKNRKFKKWTSSDGVSLIEKNGQIVRTEGLLNNVTNIRFLSETSFLRKSKLESHVISEYFLSLDNPEVFELKLVLKIENEGPEIINILDKQYSLMHITEEKENKYLRWKSKDHYWVDPEDGFVWKSIQNIAPNLPPILIEVTKKPAI